MPTAQHHRTRLNGIELHYVLAGSGPPVVLLHGWPETWYAWRKQIPALAESYSLVIPDLRGYGDSEKPAAGYDKRTMALDIRALIEHLGHKRVAIVGHDRGARVATRFAKDHPTMLDRLVVLDNIPTRVVAESMTSALAREYWFFYFNQVADLPEALIAGREELWLRHFYSTWCYDPSTITDEDVAVYVKAYSAPGGLRGAFNDYRAGGEDVAQDREDADTLIGCPVLAMWGEDFVPVGGMFDVADVWRTMAHDVTPISIAECGHLCQEEQPEFVNTQILDFLEGNRRQSNA